MKPLYIFLAISAVLIVVALAVPDGKGGHKSSGVMPSSDGVTGVDVAAGGDTVGANLEVPGATPPDESDDDDKPDESGGQGESGDKSSATKTKGSKRCVYSPKKGRYAKCSVFVDGNCKNPTSKCTPVGDCVFDKKRGKYIKCNTWTAGQCRSGVSACKPAGKCVFSAKQGKYVRCSTFSGGKCRSGAAAKCKPF